MSNVKFTNVDLNSIPVPKRPKAGQSLIGFDHNGILSSMDSGGTIVNYYPSNKKVYKAILTSLSNNNPPEEEIILENSANLNWSVVSAGIYASNITFETKKAFVIIERNGEYYGTTPIVFYVDNNDYDGTFRLIINTTNGGVFNKTNVLIEVYD